MAERVGITHALVAAGVDGADESALLAPGVAPESDPFVRSRSSVSSMSGEDEEINPLQRQLVIDEQADTDAQLELALFAAAREAEFRKQNTQDQICEALERKSQRSSRRSERSSKSRAHHRGESSAVIAEDADVKIVERERERERCTSYSV